MIFRVAEARREPGRQGDEDRRSWLRDVLPTIPAVLVSAVVAFAVAHYTAASAVKDQRVAAQQQLAAALYVPLRTALANVVACVSPRLCPDSELFRAGRSFNTAAVVVNGEGPPSVNAAVEAVQASLGLLVDERISGKRATTAQQTDAADKITTLQTRISKLLSKR